MQLEIWGRTQRESARRRKSDWGEAELTGLKFPGSKVTWSDFKSISIRRTHIVDSGWVNIRTCNFCC